MRRVIINLEQSQGATTVDVLVSAPNTVDLEGSDAWRFNLIVFGEMIDNCRKGDQAYLMEIVRVIGSELLREASCTHENNPWCTRRRHANGEIY